TDPRRRLSVKWTGAVKTMHRSQLFIRAENRKNILADISSTISYDDAEIISFNARTTSDSLAELDVVLEVSDLNHLQTIQQHLKQMPEIIDVRRR
ncbi:MAG: bifunctional (p)ppGpp synthetase/guanosine-3',5'-bis(diphosphate) 3'-pyrophosphohydrolase, partial [Desulfobulbaceae bacterium]|nr:bifunctional (p)ppGpp synthetase/guanosine-3',5'-bis(diphosphate) 3'-pyrophosphohydrolase [Desulfobulbaceae bacterium]